MNRRIRLLLVLSLCSSVLLAQNKRQGGGSAASGEGSGAPKEGGDPVAMADFAKALSVQASDDQKEQFQALASETNTAHASALQLQNEIAKSSPTAAENAAKLQAAVEKSRTATHDFIKDFTKPQKSGLKPQLQKLSKADGELEKAERELAPGNHEQLASAAEKLQKALARFQSEQASLGEEMGIQPQH